MTKPPSKRAQQASSVVKLVHLQGGNPTGSAYKIFASVVLGRSIENGSQVDIDLKPYAQSETISPRHARIWSTADDKWWIEDLGSHSGTFRRTGNSGSFTKVSTRQRVLSGDELSFGNIRFVFQAAATRQSIATPKPANASTPPSSRQPSKISTGVSPAACAIAICALIIVFLAVAAGGYWYFTKFVKEGSVTPETSQRPTGPAKGAGPTNFSGLSFPGVYIGAPTGEPLKTVEVNAEDFYATQNAWESIRSEAGQVVRNEFSVYVYPASTCVYYLSESSKVYGSLEIFQVEPPAIMGNFPKTEYIGNVKSGEYTVAEFWVTLPVKGFYTLRDPTKVDQNIKHDCLVEWK